MYKRQVFFYNARNVRFDDNAPNLIMEKTPMDHSLVFWVNLDRANPNIHHPVLYHFVDEAYLAYKSRERARTARNVNARTQELRIGFITLLAGKQ